MQSRRMFNSHCLKNLISLPVFATPVAHKCLAAELISNWSQCNRIENSTSFKLYVESAFIRAIGTNVQHSTAPFTHHNSLHTTAITVDSRLLTFHTQCWTENTKYSWNSKWVRVLSRRWEFSRATFLRKLCKFNLALVFRRKSEQNKTDYGQSSDNTRRICFVIITLQLSRKCGFHSWLSHRASVRLPSGNFLNFLQTFSLPSCCGLEPSFCLFLFDENISMGIFIYRLRNDEASRKCVL